MTNDIETRLSAQIQDLRETIAAQEAASQDVLDRLNEKQKEIDRQVDAYGLEIASRRGYERTVGLVLTVGAALAIGLGVLFSFLGLDELDKIETKVADFDKNADAIEARLDKEIATFKSELGVTIDDKIAFFFHRDEAKTETYENNVNNMKRLIGVLTQAESRWEEIKPALEGLESYDPDADLKGDYLEIIRAIATDDEENKPTRAQQVGIVLRVSEHLLQAEKDPNYISQFTHDEVFNAAQIARGLDRPDIEKQLVNSAYKLDSSSPSNKALFLQLQARYGPEDEREESFAGLLGLLDNLTMDSPHIVVAEAWNAAEGTRRYSDLIEALDRRIENAQKDPSLLLPSHIYAIKGNAHQRRGFPGELETAKQSYVDAINRLAREGTHTQWSDATIKNTLEGVQQLLRSGEDIAQIAEAAEQSGFIKLQQHLNALVLAAKFGQI